MLSQRLHGNLAIVLTMVVVCSVFNSILEFHNNVHAQTNLTETIIKASDGMEGDHFGEAVSISGDYAIVGVQNAEIDGKSYAGKAYIYKKTNAAWQEFQIIKASDGVASDYFGCSVHMSGNYAIIGSSYADLDSKSAAGKAYIFKFDGTKWIEVQILKASDGIAYDKFGLSVSISEKFAVVGTPIAGYDGKTSAGKAYVFSKL